MDRRTFLAGGLLGAATLALAGCAGALPQIDSASSAFEKKATGTVNVWCRAATQTGLASLVTSFNKSHSDLKVNLTPIPDAQYVTKLATAIRGGQPPDVVDMDDINSVLFAYRDVFADLTHVVQGLDYYKDLSTGHLDLVKQRGKIWGIPYLADNSMLYYNTDILKKADVDPASLTKGFDSLMAAAKKIKKLGGDVQPWSLTGAAAGILGFTVQPNIWATGTDMQIGTLGKQTGHIVGNDALQRTLEFYRQLWQDKLVSSGAYADQGTTWGADFRAGTVGMIPISWGSVYTADPAQLAKFDAVLLSGPDGGSAFFDGGDNMCIPNGAANPGGGWEFMKYATSLSTQAALPAGGYFPTRSDVLTPSYEKKYPLSILPLKNLDKGYAPQTLAYNLLYNQTASPFLAMFREAVFTGTVSGALKTGQSTWDRILEQSQA
ncbi:ABC transporter substrate-binding protein [Frondihabitans australicus]|uniref:Carbohydrate ABC transporter substrate-binding protein (CUT1 family) n=1 Tax=Frondihabitans australicus TaxID=386892 RepID=A0A495IKW8_9MICO|nr:sugar ABC transporter substrate-binding protein [Frondihabitans australicus]RKR76627.1 carbohydrate ABC transporter substrate-binding protein (CUT1 family) [Frondihabitans australicus]